MEVRRGVSVDVMVGVCVAAMVGVTGVLVKTLSGKVSCPDGTQPARKIIKKMMS